jgi:RNA polymerase sigma-70 factor (ECF subfamily)
MLPLDDRVISTPAEKALALNLVTATDLLRLKTIARLHARGLPAEVGWDDLLQEAFARVLVGSRRQPEGVAMIAFLAGVMRSLKAEHWRRTLKASRHEQAATGDSWDGEPWDGEPWDGEPWDGEPWDGEPWDGEPWDGEPCDAVSDPERSLSAQQELAAIEMLFKDDPLALQIIAGLAEGLSVEQIRVASGISRIDYDSARRRMRRLLLREGLTSCPQR